MSITQGLREYDQNKQLWNLSERFAVDIPRVGERVRYFIQGHLEQIDLTTKLEYSHDIAHFNLPSQILCRVIDIQLMVEPATSEISFRFILLPDTGSDPTVPDPIPPEIQQKHEVDSFYRILKASVTSTPEVSTRQQSPIPPSVISSQNVHLGTLATASHAVMTGTMFVVHYKQRASQFVIRLNKYLEAEDNNIHVGMRFKMRFQKEDSLDEISFFGTIVAIEDFCPKWPDSKWRSLKVHWDEHSNIQRPNRVSPWEIEPIIAASAGNVSNPIIVMKPLCFPSSKMSSNSTASSQPKSNKTSRMGVDGIQRASLLLKGSSSFISEPGKEKADALNDSSSFLSESEKDKASTSALARFCNWFCCCFK